MSYGVIDITKNIFGLSAHSDALRKDEFWAVDDISFELKKGEILGIIGPNGSGKTTILKMLNGIFWPDKGEIAIRGKVGALIEVGAGFHPMLTGYENIYINAAILGMTKREVNKKFDAIVQFADMGDFLDVPVKYYSSGMSVRLGFAVAVHCDPDILLVDEILSVGDINFQQKCQTIMKKIINTGTIVFVSHNLHTVSALCDRAIWLENGRIEKFSDSKTVVSSYINRKMSYTKETAPIQKSKGRFMKFVDFSILNEEGRETNAFNVGEKIVIRFKCYADIPINNPQYGIILWTQEGIRVASMDTFLQGGSLSQVEGNVEAECTFELPSLLPRKYYFSVWISDAYVTTCYDEVTNLGYFTLKNAQADLYVPAQGVCYISSKWSINNEK